MSMPSMQCDELRSMAESMGLAVPQAATLMMGAADTIDRLDAKNAKLRSICAEVAGILFNLDVDYCGLCDRDSINHPCPVHTIKGGECFIKSELRELGVDE